jgi:hypothetical protein
MISLLISFINIKKNLNFITIGIRGFHVSHNEQQLLQERALIFSVDTHFFSCEVRT